MKSYFDAAAFQQRLQSVSEKGAAPDWLIEALRQAGRHASCFQPRAEIEHHIEEFIYPH
jgi:hypothetical protein